MATAAPERILGVAAKLTVSCNNREGAVKVETPSLTADALKVGACLFVNNDIEEKRESVCMGSIMSFYY
ncbi:MAG: hypothetical protein NTW61_09470 [Candidatus Melainabacteria bacterium]|nr:hypothetical protein [Candidatus Melainabacteria bacterium]